jgi:hypothetical protein
LDISHGSRRRLGLAVAVAFITLAVPAVAMATAPPEQPPEDSTTSTDPTRTVVETTTVETSTTSTAATSITVASTTLAPTTASSTTIAVPIPTTALPATTVGSTPTAVSTIAAVANASAVSVPTGAPSVPLDVTAVPLAGGVKLSWSAPQSAGTSPILGYAISYAPAGATTWTYENASASARSLAIFGLRSFVPYYFIISARNSVGRGPYTTSLMAIPIAAPSWPRSVVATPGFNQATVRWMAPASNGGSPIQGYRIIYAPAGGTWTSVNVSASTLTRTFTGLRGGATYYFYVSAFSAVGSSSLSNIARATLTAYSVPGAVSIYSLTVGNHSVTLRWSQPDTGGLPITRYLVQIGSGGVWHNLAFLSGGTRAYTATGLVDGRTYSFRVRAANSLGWGPFV